MIIRMTLNIIIRKVSNKIIFHLMDIYNSRNIWNIFKRIFSEVCQGMIYSILQEFLNYLYMHKPKAYNKSVVEIFIEVPFLYKQLKVAIIARHNLIHRIAIVIILNSLYNNFKAITTNMFKTRNKTIEEIKGII